MLCMVKRSTFVPPSLVPTTLPAASLTTSWLSCDASAQEMMNVASSASAKFAGTVTVTAWSSSATHVPDGPAPAGMVPVQLTWFVVPAVPGTVIASEGGVDALPGRVKAATRRQPAAPARVKDLSNGISAVRRDCLGGTCCLG